LTALTDDDTCEVLEIELISKEIVVGNHHTIVEGIDFGRCPHLVAVGGGGRKKKRRSEVFAIYETFGKHTTTTTTTASYGNVCST